MLRELEPLQGKSWHEQLATLVNTAKRIAVEYQSPFKNDANGSLDCYKLEDKLDDCCRILNRYRKEDSDV